MPTAFVSRRFAALSVASAAVAIVSFALAPAATASAQAVDTTSHVVATAAPARPDSAVLRTSGRVVAVFRSSLGALSAAERATAAAHRIDALADTLAELPNDTATAVLRGVSALMTPAGPVILARGRALFTLTPADVDTIGGTTLATTTAATVAQLRAALGAAREEHGLSHLVRASALAVLATALFLLGLRLLRLGRRWLLARLPGTVEGRPVPSLAVGGHTLLGASQLLLFTARVIELATWALGLFGAYLWLAFVLTRFAYSRPWGEALGSYLRDTVVHLALAAVAGVPGLFTVVLIFVATRWAARLIGTFFEAVESGSVEQAWVHPETANATRRIAVALLWLFAVVVAYPYVPGSGGDVFKGVSVFAGLVLSLGSSGVMSQAMSGLVLMYSRALKPGDYVRVGDVEGTVTALGMLSTKIRTTKREEVTMPNAVVVGATVKNFSRLAVDEEGVIVHTAVTIGYDTPWRQVEAMLVMAAGRTSGLLESPRPFVLKTALSDFYIEYQLNAHLLDAQRRIAVLSTLHEHIADVFNEHGVQITSPHYVADPPNPAVVPRDRWYAPPARPPATG